MQAVELSKSATDASDSAIARPQFAQSLGVGPLTWSFAPIQLRDESFRTFLERLHCNHDLSGARQ